ncbi:hypothetical protein N0V82_008939 [Gnomoniopsis sp. IMI 355080]|nr:hypothetical protein N0V82_008939 [Gnomoniopsis sp. IMI 355080]
MAAAATPPGVVDPTKPAKYPVILSDALLGKSSPKEILTALKYNHKPSLSSDAAPSSAKVKPSSNPGSYDLSFTDDGGKYAYSGTRSTKENQYVLLFDPERKAFVLHRVDSTLNMNLTRTPSNTDADALKDEFPHLDSNTNTNNSIRVSADGRKKPGGNSGKGKGKASAKNAGMVESKRSTAPAKTKPEPAKKEEKPKRSRSPVDSEEEEESDDDDMLQIEYPDPQPTASVHSSFNRPQQQPSELGLRRFSSFKEDDSDEDADAEYDEDDLIPDEAGDSSAGDGFKLPSPLGRNGAQKVQDEDADADADADADMEPEVDDLEALLEQELGGAMDVDSESSVSEED